MAQTPVAEPPGLIYRLRVVLAGISPMIWRQLEVPDSITIAGLHEVLRVAFGWRCDTRSHVVSGIIRLTGCLSGLV